MDEIKAVKKTLLCEDEKSIYSSYDMLMRSFDASRLSDMFEEGTDDRYKKLYAPGYDEIGVGDIVAQCK